ncbi:MAG TPA: DoxX family membrane protein [Rhizomicrobium sp.]|jgi:uncharacterized membrane protein YphA (DoxX/SURF4 family)|nr:DoxX family membrane protein [Rhizomicrobium sp.]
MGHLFFALGFAVIGAIGIAVQGFVLNQQPVPKDIPWRETLACLSGAVLLLAGIGSLVTRTARISALILSGYLFLWVLVLQLPRVVAHPDVEVYWLGLGEDLSLATGGWLIYCAIAGRNDVSVHAARIAFGIALVPIGLSHFFYLKLAASFIPSWLPFHVPLTMLTGAGHIAAGVAIALGVVPRLAAALEAMMESLITLIVWISAVAAAPASREDWVNLCISTAITGAAWAVSESLGNPSIMLPSREGRNSLRTQREANFGEGDASVN